MRLRIPRVRIRVDWQNVHFCKADKVKYRMHITVGMVLVTLLAIIGTATGHQGLTHLASIANMVTAILWIWE